MHSNNDSGFFRSWKHSIFPRIFESAFLLFIEGKVKSIRKHDPKWVLQNFRGNKKGAAFNEIDLVKNSSNCKFAWSKTFQQAVETFFWLVFSGWVDFRLVEPSTSYISSSAIWFIFKYMTSFSAEIISHFLCLSYHHRRYEKLTRRKYKRTIREKENINNRINYAFASILITFSFIHQ